MVAKIIRIVIEEIEEDGEKYYLARSPDVPWFLTETSTLQEMFDLAPQVMSDFLSASKKILEKEQAKKNIQHHFLGKYFLWKVIYNLSYNISPDLQLA